MFFLHAACPGCSCPPLSPGAQPWRDAGWHRQHSLQPLTHHTPKGLTQHSGSHTTLPPPHTLPAAQPSAGRQPSYSLHPRLSAGCFQRVPQPQPQRPRCCWPPLWAASTLWCCGRSASHSPRAGLQPWAVQPLSVSCRPGAGRERGAGHHPQPSAPGLASSHRVQHPISSRAQRSPLGSLKHAAVPSGQCKALPVAWRFFISCQ